MATYYVDGAVGSDSNAGTSPGAGNAYATIGKAQSVAAAGDTVYIKASATYTLASTVSWTNDGDTTTGRIVIEGYTTTPGARDGRPTITSSTNSVHLFTLNGANYLAFRHLKFTHTAGTRGDGFHSASAASNFIAIEDCVIDGCAEGITGGSFDLIDVSVFGCEIKNCTGDGIYAVQLRWYIIGCYIHGNTGVGIKVDTNSDIEIWGNIISGNSYGVDVNNSLSRFLAVGNTFHGNTNSGIRSLQDATHFSRFTILQNNLFTSNGAYGVDFATSTAISDALVLVNRNNVYGSGGLVNTSGGKHNISAGYGDVTTADNLYGNAASGDFSLTGSGAAAAKAVAYPGVFAGATSTGYLDAGAVQHQDSGGVGSSAPVGQCCM